MSFKNDLKRVIWHELGHLCIDVIQIDNFNEYKIQELGLCYHPKANQPYNWQGWVKTTPEYKGLGEIKDLTAFYLLGSKSGCLFQQAYFYVIVGNKLEGLKFERCFAFRQPGEKDLFNFNGVNRLFRQNHGRNNECINFIEGNDLLNLYRDILFNDLEFLNLINILSIRCYDHVIDNYSSKEERQDYSYVFNNEFLNELIKDVSNTVKSSKFYSEIIELKRIMVEKMTYERE